MNILKWPVRPAPSGRGGVWCDNNCCTSHNHHQVVCQLSINSQRFSPSRSVSSRTQDRVFVISSCSDITNDQLCISEEIVFRGRNLPTYWDISCHLMVVLTIQVRCVTPYSSPTRPPGGAGLSSHVLMYKQFFTINIHKQRTAKYSQFLSNNTGYAGSGCFPPLEGPWEPEWYHVTSFWKTHDQGYYGNWGILLHQIRYY